MHVYNWIQVLFGGQGSAITCSHAGSGTRRVTLVKQLIEWGLLHIRWRRGELFWWLLSAATNYRQTLRRIVESFIVVYGCEATQVPEWTLNIIKLAATCWETEGAAWHLIGHFFFGLYSTNHSHRSFQSSWMKSCTSFFMFCQKLHHHISVQLAQLCDICLL